MAFEGLVIELIQEKKHPQGFSEEAWETLGIELGLDKNSVFDYGIWDKFINWTGKKKCDIQQPY